MLFASPLLLGSVAKLLCLQIAPAEAAGVSKLEASTFVLECLETPTGAYCLYQAAASQVTFAFAGVKFFVTASKGTSDLSQLLQATYKLYADYVTKNPFQASDNVIKCALFDAHLDTYLSKHWGSGVGGYRPAPAAASRR